MWLDCNISSQQNCKQKIVVTIQKNLGTFLSVHYVNHMIIAIEQIWDNFISIALH